MNFWAKRFALGLLIWAVMKAHVAIVGEVPNTPFGMLIYHGSASLCDLMILYSLPTFLNGKCLTDMEAMCIASILGNTIGWFLYLAYAPPVFYDTFMWGLSYVQWFRILLVDSDDPYYMGGSVVRGGVGSGC